MNPQRLRHVVVSCLLSLLGGLMPATASAELVLAAPGQAPAPLFSRSYPGDERRFQVHNAAKKLAEYLEQIGGQKHQVDRGEPDPAKPHIMLERVRREDLGDGQRDSFEIIVTDANVTLRANSERAVFFMVFEFLRQHLGCQWLSSDEEVVPKQDRIALQPGRTLMVPAFDYFHLYNLEATSGYHQYQIRGYGTLRFTGNHTLYPLLQKAGAANPHFYPMNDKGERKANNLHFCYLADGIVDALTEALAAEVEQRKGNVEDYIYFAGMGDWYGGTCQCPACKAVYEEEAWQHPDGRRLPGVTATLLRMINATAEKLEQRYPGVQVGTFAYMSLEAPPAKTVPGRNVHIWVPRLRHDTIRPVDDPQSGNASYFGNLQRWCELAPGRVHVWDYGGSFDNFLMPFPALRSIARNIQVYHRLGVAGVMVQGNYVSTGGDQNVLKNAVFAQLLWDPQQDAEKLIDDFCRTYYGPAADLVQQYLRTLEAGARKPGKPIDEMANARKAFLTDELLAELEALIARAVTAAGAEPYIRRVRELGAGIEAARLWSTGPLEERNGQLIRTDLGGYTYERAKALESHLRGASPREWGDGWAYRLDFLRLHGGPVHTFKRGRLEVKAAPAQFGRIGPVTWDGQVVIEQMIDRPDLGVRFMETLGEPTATGVAMEGPVGVGHWGSSSRIHTGRRAVEVTATNAFTVRGWLRRDTKNTLQTGVTATSEFAPQVQQQPTRIQWRNNRQRWAELPPGTDKEPARELDATALRVRVGSFHVNFEWHGEDELQEMPLEVRAWTDPKTKRVITGIVVPPRLFPADAMSLYLVQNVRLTPAAGGTNP